MKVSGPVAWGFAGIATLAGVSVFLFLKKNEQRLIAQAMEAAKNDRELTFGMEKELLRDGEQQNDK